VLLVSSSSSSQANRQYVRLAGGRGRGNGVWVLLADFFVSKAGRQAGRRGGPGPDLHCGCGNTSLGQSRVWGSCASAYTRCAHVTLTAAQCSHRKARHAHQSTTSSGRRSSHNGAHKARNLSFPCCVFSACPACCVWQSVGTTRKHATVEAGGGGRCANAARCPSQLDELAQDRLQQ